MTLQLVERIQLRPSKDLSRLCHLAKNLYNEANFHVRQFFFNLEELINYYDLQVILKKAECYKALPAQTSQQILELVAKNWKAYFAALREYKANPGKFWGRPRPPKYKPRDGESIAIFTNQNTRVKDGQVHFPKSCNLPPIKTRILQYQQVRILPQAYGYIMEIVYNKEETGMKLNPDHILGIDLGLRRLITAVNNIGLPPFVIKGGMVKSANQFYNKVNASLQSQKDPQKYKFQTKGQLKLLQKRNNRINDVFHKASNRVIKYCVQNDIGTTVIGYNEGWKHEIDMGKRNNQNFVQVPFLRLIRLIQYKAKLAGIRVVVNEESYTSKCSFLDDETIEKHDTYCGKRVSRGLFRTAKGKIIHADVNGGYNIVKKAVPKAFCHGIEGLALIPYSLQI